MQTCLDLTAEKPVTRILDQLLNLPPSLTKLFKYRSAKRIYEYLLMTMGCAFFLGLVQLINHQSIVGIRDFNDGASIMSDLHVF